MTIRGGGHPKQAMVPTPSLRMGPPPRSLPPDPHHCIMVWPPLDLPNTRLWRDDLRPMASSPLIVDARLSPTNLPSSLRTVSDSVARGGNRDGWSARASQQGDRAASAASDARKGWKLKLVRPGPNDRRGQVESLGRNRLTPDAPLGPRTVSSAQLMELRRRLRTQWRGAPDRTLNASLAERSRSEPLKCKSPFQ